MTVDQRMTVAWCACVMQGQRKYDEPPLSRPPAPCAASRAKALSSLLKVPKVPMPFPVADLTHVGGKDDENKDKPPLPVGVTVLDKVVEQGDPPGRSGHNQLQSQGLAMS
jgi:hypothetical protein